MANLKKLKKELLKLEQEELKEVLEFALVDDDEEETKEEVVETKEEVKEEPKKEEKVEQPKYATLDDIKGLLEGMGYVKKEELEAVTKKAKPFGVEPAQEKPLTKTTSRTTQDYLAMVNEKQY